MTDLTSRTFVGSLILSIANFLSSAGDIPCGPNLCLRNSNSCLKKPDFDSFTFSLAVWNLVKMVLKCVRCCSGESLKHNRSSMYTRQNCKQLKSSLFIGSFKKSGDVVIPKLARVNSNFLKSQTNAVLCLSSGLINI